MNGNIAIIAALEGELRPLVTDRTARSWKRLASSPGTKVWEYRHSQGCWLAVCAGMGAARAALAFEEADRAMSLDAVCSAGWAGSLLNSIPAGSVHRVSIVVDAENGEEFRTAHSVTGLPVLASCTHVADVATKQRLAAIHRAGLVDMEAASVARFASRRSVPFYCIKAVSDDAADRLPDFDKFIHKGELEMGPLVFHIAARPQLWMSMMRLRRNSRESAMALSDVLYDWLDERMYIRTSTGDYTKLTRGE